METIATHSHVQLTVYELLALIVYTVGIVFAISKVYYSLISKIKRLQLEFTSIADNINIELAKRKGSFDVTFQKIEDEVLLIRTALEKNNYDWKDILSQHINQNNEAHQKIVVNLEAIGKLLNDLEVKFAEHRGEHKVKTRSTNT